MIINITLIIAILVAINFLLLKFSCNKTVRKNKTSKTPVILRPELNVKTISPQHLAPTGSF